MVHSVYVLKALLLARQGGGGARGRALTQSLPKCRSMLAKGDLNLVEGEPPVVVPIPSLKEEDTWRLIEANGGYGK